MKYTKQCILFLAYYLKMIYWGNKIKMHLK